MLSELRLVEKEIDSGNPAVLGNDEIGSRVSRRLAGASRYPSAARAISQFLRLGDQLISKLGMSSLDRAGDAIDLVAAAIDALRLVEHHVFGVDLLDGRAPARR